MSDIGEAPLLSMTAQVLDEQRSQRFLSPPRPAGVRAAPACRPNPECSRWSTSCVTLVTRAGVSTRSVWCCWSRCVRRPAVSTPSGRWGSGRRRFPRHAGTTGAEPPRRVRPGETAEFGHDPPRGQRSDAGRIGGAAPGFPGQGAGGGRGRHVPAGLAGRDRAGGDGAGGDVAGRDAGRTAEGGGQGQRDHRLRRAAGRL